MGVGYWVVRCEVGIWQAWPGSRILADMRAEGCTPVRLRGGGGGGGGGGREEGGREGRGGRGQK